jgi:AraC family transcriptional regulator, regulatory protein of adaptative response / DNA-3-methyladenine glycosylase II
VITRLPDPRLGVRVVHSTGIYCRADCPARPNPANTGVLASVAAAESAGYRACLRCRSDRLPVVRVDQSQHEQVARALDLICDGFLDHHREADLAARLGYSSRHLRRLFLDAVAATPSHVARSRRAHFARLLLDETDLPVTQIAYAAGFRSLRRMNEVMHATFGFTPTQLRNTRARGEHNAVDGGLRLRLYVDRSYDFDGYVASLSTTAISGLEVVDGRRYRRAVSVCGHPGVVELDSPSPRRVDVVAHLPALEGLVDVVSRCRRVLGLDRTADSPPGVWSTFEAAVVAAARAHCDDPDRTLERLVRRHGQPVPGAADVGITHVFPTPERLATVRSSSTSGLSRQAAAAIRELATAELVATSTHAPWPAHLSAA